MMNLKKNNIIEKIKGLTPWVPNKMPVAIQKHDVRICLNMRQANNAI